MTCAKKAIYALSSIKFHTSMFFTIACLLKLGGTITVCFAHFKIQLQSCLTLWASNYRCISSSKFFKIYNIDMWEIVRGLCGMTLKCHDFEDVDCSHIVILFHPRLETSSKERIQIYEGQQKFSRNVKQGNKNSYYLFLQSWQKCVIRS